MAFVQKHLPDPFYLQGDQRISIRDAIFREVASNILIHREYRNAFPAKLIIERGQVRTENSNKPHGFGVLDPDTFTPFPKNPVIGAFFREIHRADELGSGMRNMIRYGKAYGGEDPQMIEGDVFRIIVKVPEFGSFGEQYEKKESGDAAPQVTPEVTQEAIQEVILEATPEVRLVQVLSGEMRRQDLQQAVGLKDDEHFRKYYLLPALDAGLIEMTIPDKPRSSKQKYRLTSKGLEHVAKLQKNLGSFGEQYEKKESGDAAPQVTPELTQEAIQEVTPEVTPEVRLVQVLSGEMRRQDLQQAVGLKDDEHFRKYYLLPALDAGLIEMTIPDKPRSSKQKYRLTSRGLEYIAKIQKNL